MRRNFLGLDTSAAEDGRVVAPAGGSKGVEGREEERNFRAIAAFFFFSKKGLGWIESEALEKCHVSTRRNTQETATESEKDLRILTEKKDHTQTSERDSSSLGGIVSSPRVVCGLMERRK